MNGEAGDQRPPDGPGFAGAWPWLVFPLLPLLGGFGLLKLLYAPEFTFAQGGPGGSCLDPSPNGFVAAFTGAVQRSYLAFEGLTVYGSVSLLHIGLCLFAILYFTAQIRALPQPDARRAWQLAGLLIVLLLVIGFAARLDSTALQLSYRNVCELLCKARVASHIVPADCRGGAASPLLLLASLPTLVGLIAAVLAAALSSAETRPLPAGSETEWRAAFTERVHGLQRTFYVTSLILVTSTVAIMLFQQLPVPLVANEPTELAVASAARGLTVFWGTVFTLTLFAIFAPATVRLLQAAEHHVATSQAPAELRSWLRAEVAVSIPKQLGNLVAALAPLLVGPVGSLLEKLASAG